jgi:hypothetical protein
MRFEIRDQDDFIPIILNIEFTSQDELIELISRLNVSQYSVQHNLPMLNDNIVGVKLDNFCMLSKELYKLAKKRNLVL